MKSLILAIILLQATIVGCGAELSKLDNDVNAMNPSPTPTPSPSPSFSPIPLPSPTPSPVVAPQIEIINNTTINSSSTTIISSTQNWAEQESPTYPKLKVEGSKLKPQFFSLPMTWNQAIAVTPPGYRLASRNDISIMFLSGAFLSLGEDGQGIWTGSEDMGDEAWSANVIEGTVEPAGKQSLFPAVYVPE